MKMAGSIIDTNVIIKFLDKNENAILIFERESSIAVPAIVVGELFYGANKSKKIADNISIFSEFLSKYSILPVDNDTAIIYGKIKAQLVKSGFTIP